MGERANNGCVKSDHASCCFCVLVADGWDEDRNFAFPATLPSQSASEHVTNASPQRHAQIIAVGGSGTKARAAVAEMELAVQRNSNPAFSLSIPLHDQRPATTQRPQRRGLIDTAEIELHQPD